MYFEDLLAANDFTQRIGLPGIQLSKSHQNSCLQDESFFLGLGKLLKIDELSELVANCNIVSQVVCEAINTELGCKAYLTIGDVTFSGKPFFDVNEAYMENLVAAGKGSQRAQSYRHHAWVTLETMEIIDFTLNTSMALLSKDLSPETRSKMLGGVLSGYADCLTGGVRYHPVLIGEDFYNNYDSIYPHLKSIYKGSLDKKTKTESVFVRSDI